MFDKRPIGLIEELTSCGACGCFSHPGDMCRKLYLFGADKDGNKGLVVGCFCPTNKPAQITFCIVISEAIGEEEEEVNEDNPETSSINLNLPPRK